MKIQKESKVLIKELIGGILKLICKIWFAVPSEKEEKKNEWVQNFSQNQWNVAWSLGALPKNRNWRIWYRGNVIKKVLKFAPLKSDLLRAIESDETIKNELAIDMTEITAQKIADPDMKIEEEKEK